MLPEGSSFHTEVYPTDEGTLAHRFGESGLADRARYLASLYILDLAKAVHEIDAGFGLSSYAERLAACQPSFDPLLAALEDEKSFIGTLIDEIALEFLSCHTPELLGISIPFPGNVYGAFRIARLVRRQFPKVKVVFGGGWINTDLRHLSDPRVFDFVDFVTLDAGERPLECIVEHLQGGRPASGLLRTLIRTGDRVATLSSFQEKDVSFQDFVTPCYDGIELDSYLATCTGTTSVHRIWAGRWNKLTLAHGCYWRRCTFCDVSLDYISRYQAQSAARLVEHIRKIIEETGHTGFHWVDEAAPPALLRQLSQLLLDGGIQISWWSMVRFEKAFTPALARLMAEAGCVMLSGGLEVASDRVLRLIEKGVSVAQVARVTKNLADAGILVHAFLMYGFPSQTVQETIDSLEIVRQLFANGCLHSAFWHRFVATIHSPVGQNPEKYGIRIVKHPRDDASRYGQFSGDILEFEDPVGTDHESLGDGLHRAVLAFREGHGLGDDVRRWFPDSMPATAIPADLVVRALESADHPPSSIQGQEWRKPI